MTQVPGLNRGASREGRRRRGAPRTALSLRRARLAARRLLALGRSLGLRRPPAPCPRPRGRPRAARLLARSPPLAPPRPCRSFDREGGHERTPAVQKSTQDGRLFICF